MQPITEGIEDEVETQCISMSKMVLTAEIEGD